MLDPFFVEAPERSDRPDKHPRAKLFLMLLIVDVTWTARPAGIKVVLRAANASGSYSSFVQNPGTGLVNHRGTMPGFQRTDANGCVPIHAIVPGVIQP
jgi:protocatechuate 3,4-dioxygenase beta subunit